MGLDDVKQYYKYAREDMLPFLPEKVTRMLDVGCGSGAFAEMCKQKFGCETWGVEYVPEVAETAKSRVDHVFSGDAMEQIPKLPDATFDMVTFTDVLEHLAWPAEALKLTRRVLAPGGVVIASIPNIRYWPALLAIVRDKDFPAEDSGIFDRTHLRFFTGKSIPRLFEAANYQIDRQEGINPGKFKVNFDIVNFLSMNRLADCRFLQYVVVTRPKPD